MVIFWSYDVVTRMSCARWVIRTVIGTSFPLHRASIKYVVGEEDIPQTLSINLILKFSLCCSFRFK